MISKLNITTYKEFYLYYLTQHMEYRCRTLHFIGTGLGFLCLTAIFITGKWWLFFVGLTLGYGFAWTGHFFFEKNKPAAFSNPWWSFISDWVMFKDILTFQIGGKLITARNKYGEYISETALKSIS
jgi:hypothetical protein